MCGIFALLTRRPLTGNDLKLGRAGREALVHRGPDAAGEFVDTQGGLYLGHRRLKIIDLSERAAQPMRAENHVLAFNGEIYNYTDLKREHEAAGRVFRSDSDTEVLLAEWLKYGSAALDRIDGMFAFVMWDGEQAWIAVDRFGEKSLYLAENESGVVVSSELRPLVDLLELSPGWDDEFVAEFMTLGYVSLPRTGYKNVSRLEPGSLVRVSAGVRRESRRYWRLPEVQQGRGKVEEISEKNLDRIQEAILSSLRRRLVADVPICIFLSNGVDSSLVAAMCAKDLGQTIGALTVTLPDGGAPDESAAAERFAANVGIDHRRVTVSDPPQMTGPRYLLDVFGQPNDNTGVTSVHGLARAARSLGYVVGLTGNGGDEAFFGYQKQAFAWRFRHLYALPERLRLFLGWMSAPLDAIWNKASIFRDVFSVRDGERYVSLKNRRVLGVLRQMPGFDAWRRRRFDGGPAFPMFVPDFERRDVLPGQQLLAVDHGSMAASVELRTPFLDRRLFEILAEFDPRAFLAFGHKSVLRRLLARYVSLNLVGTAKMGLVFPPVRFSPSLSSEVPLGSRIPTRAAAAILANRTSPDWERLAVRLALLQAWPQWLSAHSRSGLAEMVPGSRQAS
jgi:asparagine synthase (glutamine-hydrolysing)